MFQPRSLVRSALAATLIASLAAAAPAAAQERPSDEPDLEKLPEKLDEAWRDLMERLEPAFDELMETLETFKRIDGLEHYERPEVLPNGDIIIRRRPDAPPLPPAPELEDEGPGIKT